MNELIPKTLHRIWCGDAEIPAHYEHYWKAWRRQLPDYQMITWHDDDLAKFSDIECLNRAASVTQRADIARYMVLGRHGGVYLDCDVMPFQWRDWSQENGLVTCNENDGDKIRSIGFIAAPPGDPTFKRALDLISASELGVRPPNEETGPTLFRKAIEKETRLPARAIYPYLYDQPFSLIFEDDLSETFAVHVWGMSWLSDQAKLANARKWLGYGDIAAVEGLLAHIHDPGTEEMANLCQSIRKRRLGLWQALGWSDQIPGDDWLRPTPLEPRRLIPNGRHPSFHDMAWWLLESDANCRIWQIGAADGILVDPLRPLLVNFDPNTAVVEPNPFLFDRLRGNYRYNENMTFHHAAIAPTVGRSQFYAVDPQLVAKFGLPDWTLGLSSMHKDRNALGGISVDEEIRNRLWRAVVPVEVETMTVLDLFVRDGCRWPDILVVDAEGADATIVADTLLGGAQPKIILFEHVCIPHDELTSLQNKAADEYVWIRYREDFGLYRKDFYAQYARSVFVGQGRWKLTKSISSEVLLNELERSLIVTKEKSKRQDSGSGQEETFETIFVKGRDYARDQRPDFLRDLARVHRAAGDLLEAKRLLEAALNERPHGPYIKQLLDQILSELLQS